MTDSFGRNPAFCAHDHRVCRQDTLALADQIVTQKGVRMTPVRRRTLEILLQAHRALGAYDVLEQLAADGYSKQPPVAYRALEFLVENGLAHRIRRLNAFIACLHPGQAHTPAFFICRQCDVVAEAPAAGLYTAVEAAASALEFAVERTTIEAVGLCPKCQDPAR